MRVLHVSEALGGGVTSAVTAMVEATPEVDHHLFARPRQQHDIGIEPARHFASVHPMSGNPASAVLALRSVVRQLYPDVVHAHSSVAGVLVRMAMLDRPSIVYSPHCFAFERRDIGGPSRRVFRAVERVLAPRTDLFMAVAPQEMDLAADLGHQSMAYVPNRAVTEPRPVAEHADRLRIVTVGRVCAQKDWRYLVHLKRFVDDHLALDATWEWLGDGDPEGERELDDAGIDVSGWIPREEVLDRLASAQVYVHTAAWEGAPISILEAASLGLPLAVRSIPSLDSLALPGLSVGVAALAARIESLVGEPAWRAASDSSLDLAGRHSAEAQARHLMRAYQRATGAVALPGVSAVPTWLGQTGTDGGLRGAGGAR